MHHGTSPGRISRIFHREQPTEGIGARLRPRPWKRRVGKSWCIREAKVSPFCSAVGGSLGRRRGSGFRRAPAGSGNGGGGGPAALGWGGCGPRDARKGGGAGWEERRCRGARAGRVTGHAGAGGVEEKLKSRFRD